MKMPPKVCMMCQHLDIHTFKCRLNKKPCNDFAPVPPESLAEYRVRRLHQEMEDEEDV